MKAELTIWAKLFSSVDLLTLSACNTAVGDRLRDGKEVESFGVIGTQSSVPRYGYAEVTLLILARGRSLRPVGKTVSVLNGRQ